MGGEFEVAVIGGGPAGSLTAMLLARRGCHVVVVDKSRPDAFCVGETLPPQMSQLLSDLALFDRFRVQGHRVSPGILSAWGSAEPTVSDFLFSPHGDGWHIDRPKFNILLREAAIEAGVCFLPNTLIRTCTATPAGPGWTLCTGDDAELRCQFLVDASGRTAAGRFPHASRLVYDHLVSIASLAGRGGEGSGTAPDYTLIEPVHDGWFYSALLPNEQYIVTFTTDADVYATGRAQSPTYLDDQLWAAPLTSSRLGRFGETTVTFPAVTMQRKSVAQPNWMAVGDAARSYDPLSGHGLWNSMQAATRAAPAILEALAGDAAASVEYEAAHHRSFAKYQQMHAGYYAIEQRWRNSLFWARRHRGLEPRSMF